MQTAYRETPSKEVGARKALDVYNGYIVHLEYIAAVMSDIEDFHNLLADALDRLEDARDREEKKTITIRGGGTHIVKLIPCGKQCRGCPHGPYAYQVTRVGGRQVWKYLGRAKGEGKERVT